MNHEAVLLSLILRNEDLWFLTGMRHEFFGTPLGRSIFDAMDQAMKTHGYISRDTVSAALTDPRLIDTILREAEADISTASWEFHRKQILKKWKQTAIVQSYMEAKEAIEDGADPDEIAEQIINDIQAIRTEHAQDASVSYKDRVKRVLDELSRRRAVDGLPGLATGVRAIDAVTGGFQRRRLYYIAGRPSQGKSALLGQCADYIARSGVPVGYFSLESADIEVITRNWSRNNHIHQRLLQNGMITARDFAMLSQEIDNSDKIPLWIDDTPNADLNHIKRQATIWKARYNIQVLFVDYVQLIRVPTASDRREAVEEASRSLKDLSRHLDIPVVAAAQLRRSDGEYKDRAPRLGDFQHSSALEQDADVALLLHWLAEYGDNIPVDGILAKNRDGEKARIEMTFQGNYVKFTERMFEDDPTEQT